MVALFNSAFTLGLFVGPFASSYIVLSTSFTTTTDVESLVCVTFMVLYFIFVWIPLKIQKMKEPSKPKKRGADIDAISDAGSINLEKEEDKVSLL